MSADDNARRGRENVERGRWAAYKAARIAAGLPATKAEERRRKPRFLDVDSEPYWLDKADSLGLLDGLDRTAARRVAKRLADDATAEEGRRSEFDAPAAPPLGDDDLLVAHFENEIARWRARGERDRQVAAQHDGYADDAAQALATLMAKLGRI